MLESFKPVDQRRLYQQIADQVRALIQAESFPVGARLPPERDLAQRFGVSRASLREALIALEIEGSVEIRMGAGVFVCRPLAAAPAITASMGESPVEVMQARSALEGTVVVMACARVTPDGITALERALTAMRAAIAGGHSPLLPDREFHLAIASMTGNSVLERLVSSLFDERHGPLSTKMTVRAESRETWLEALHEHQEILAAFEQRDALRAEAAMRSHLRASQRRWLESGPAEW